MRDKEASARKLGGGTDRVVSAASQDKETMNRPITRIGSGGDITAVPARKGAAWGLVFSSWFPVLTLLAGCLLVGCKSATVTGQRELAPAGAAKPTIIYVADFELDAATIQHEAGILPETSGPLGRVGRRLSGAPQDPQTRARELVVSMAVSIVKKLTKSDLAASRLTPGMPLPRDGWLVRGIFTEVQEGNRLRRAMIGFGVGQTDLQVVAVIDNLSQGPPQPLYEVATEADSGKPPGAAPMLVLSPYGAAVRFVMAGGDLKKNVKQTAAQIAAQVAKRVGEIK